MPTCCPHVSILMHLLIHLKACIYYSYLSLLCSISIAKGLCTSEGGYCFDMVNDSHGVG